MRLPYPVIGRLGAAISSTEVLWSQNLETGALLLIHQQHCKPVNGHELVHLLGEAMVDLVYFQIRGHDPGDLTNGLDLCWRISSR